jgi:general stress protein YciG
MTKKRGFASMDAAKQREIASKGGKAAHQKGTAHQFTQEEARAAGRKGGQAAHSKGTAHKFTSDEARAAGRKGGRSSRSVPEMTPATSTTPPPAPEAPPETPPESTGATYVPYPYPAMPATDVYYPDTMPSGNHGQHNPTP